MIILGCRPTLFQYNTFSKYTVITYSVTHGLHNWLILRVFNDTVSASQVYNVSCNKSWLEPYRSREINDNGGDLLSFWADTIVTFAWRNWGLTLKFLQRQRVTRRRFKPSIPRVQVQMNLHKVWETRDSGEVSDPWRGVLSTNIYSRLRNYHHSTISDVTRLTTWSGC
jgi:hypothetical protein